MKKIYRHGDVILLKIEALPDGLKKIENNGSFVLALGETTGHKHVLTAPKIDLEVYQDAQGRNYFKVNSDARLSHEEHGTLVITPDIYVQGQEREKDWFSGAVRKVVD